MHKTVDKDQLIQQITAAFSEAEYPGDDNLINQSYGDEPALVKKHFAGQGDWKKMTRDFLDFDGALSFLSNKAFRFYVPAFMITDIQERLDFNDPTIRLCWSLTPQSENEKIANHWGNGTVGTRAKECFDEFSKDQVNAIVFYLQWRLLQEKNNYTIQGALENYWLLREKNIR